ncbi:MAG: hypothetical protein BGO52_01475 [Sphingobacteriales bacterium 44-61]|nr:MAG: hypothetical protein BGO52_01475 [Sphingobacteriales bacterium 44-61]
MNNFPTKTTKATKTYLYLSGKMLGQFFVAFVVFVGNVTAKTESLLMVCRDTKKAAQAAIVCFYRDRVA